MCRCFDILPKILLTENFILRIVMLLVSFAIYFNETFLQNITSMLSRYYSIFLHKISARPVKYFARYPTENIYITYFKEVVI